MSTRALQLVVGSPEALERRLLQSVIETREQQALAPLDILIGGVLQRPYLQRRIADTTAGLINVRVSTLGEFGVRLGELTLMADGRRPLPAIAERAYAAEVGRGSGGYFEPVAGTPGFAEVARRLVRELRQEGVTPERLAQVAPKAAESVAKSDAVVDLYRRYLHGRAGYYDGEDALAAANPDRFDGAALMLFGIWRLSAVSRRLLEQLAERVPVIVFLPSGGSDDADGAHAELRAWAVSAGGSVERVDGDGADNALGALQARLLLPPTEPGPTDASVDLISAPDALTEVREAARVCLAWARDGIAFREMAVTYRQASLYRPLVESVFAEAGLSVYLDDGPSLAERPLGRRILALLDLIGTDLARRDLMSFLSDGWLPKETRERFGGAPAARWDSASRRAGVVSGVDQWRTRLRLLHEKEREAAEQPDAPEWLARRADDGASLLAFVEDLAARLTRLPGRASWRACLDALRDLLVVYVRDCEDVLGYLESLAELDSLVPEVEFTRFLDVVRAEVRALKAGDLDEGQQGAFGRRGINVLDTNAIRSLRFRAVCVLGLNERSFPPPPRQDPLLLDDERRALNDAGGWTLPLRAAGADPEPLQFALAVNAARDRLLLGTRRADQSGGRAQLPSSFFRAAAGVFAGRRVQASEVERLPFVRRIGAGTIAPGGPEAALTLAERDRTLLANNAGLGRALIERLHPPIIRSDALRRARWRNRELTPFDGLLVSQEAVDAAITRFRDGRVLSITGLESYATCPFQYFLRNVLRVKPLDEPEHQLRMPRNEVGSLMHTVLERFVAALPEGGLDPARSGAHHTELQRLAESVLDEAEQIGVVGSPLLWFTDRQEIIDDLAAWLDVELADPGRHRDRHLELSFGYSGKSALELPVGENVLRLGGRIDRLDHGPDGFRVVDYKSGRGARGKDGELDGGKSLQLPLYVLAGAMILDRDPSQGEAAFHNVSRRGDLRRVHFRSSDIADRADDVALVLERIVGGIASGDFHVEPGDACRYCDYADLCDVGRGRIAERKRDDPRMRTFMEMGEVQ